MQHKFKSEGGLEANNLVSFLRLACSGKSIFLGGKTTPSAGNQLV